MVKKFNKNKFMNSVSTMLKKYRKEHELSQKALSLMLGLSQSSLSKVESGKKDLDLEGFILFCILADLDLSDFI